MNKSLYINNYVRISENKVNNSGTILTIHKSENESLSKKLYKDLDIKYPKFYKMDKLSKFGFLAAEYLKQHQNFDENTALVFANRTASLDTDVTYSKSIQEDNFMPSPSVFVYTLPNIVMGEISIRHKLMGENMFLIQEAFNEEELIKTIHTQFQLQKAKSFILAWLEILNEEIDIFACYITESATKKSIILNKENLTKLYKS